MTREDIALQILQGLMLTRYKEDSYSDEAAIEESLRLADYFMVATKMI